MRCNRPTATVQLLDDGIAMLSGGAYVTVPIKEIKDTVIELTEVKGTRPYR
jgi:hypothetical protein